MQGKSFFIDLTRCTACRGCQVACKQWHKLPAEETRNWGSHQNPKDLSFITYKLVRFQEITQNGRMQDWLFFPEQCRHCVDPPCKLTADMYDDKAILQDPVTGAVIFTERTKKLDIMEIRGSCPYDIPRQDADSKIMGKCDMCLDRVQNGLLPACVQVCPTGAMNFGDREEMMDLAKERLKTVQKRYPEAVLGDAEAVRVIYLYARKPEQYHSFAVASAAPLRQFTRKELLARLRKPVTTMLG
ncbi:4Fe-4S dicluster domain-containing protein [Desulfohalobium retbaense]|jgi:formate dehydrogenase iron-sulfur subunit|uniref:Formate dehydrogenase, beta subunit, putative n=1 Tax=Desulfohalobium retbaense (strain ATCC 49708 / DSM 5692 / JCM 16813 / HR100) TaxID=485915 RepID=C8WZQ4_DESRD|nr:4Fe-4S dicluster domain-containing protein [Desulfohalobium retbaense]ACV67529.1 formate dehydrogenase, beta subunit, putative [Desulfohalobium retbaense DSM 5692]